MLPSRLLTHFAAIGLLWPLSTTQAQLYFDVNDGVLGLNAGTAAWDLTSNIWNPSSAGGSGNQAWVNGSSMAVFQTGGSNQLTLSGSIQAGGIHQLGASTSTSLTGTGVLTFGLGSDQFTNESGDDFTFGANVDLVLQAPSTSEVAEWFTDEDARTLVNGTITSNLGSITGSDITGGWRIAGEGVTELNGDNQNLNGVVRIAGNVEAGHANAFGDSLLAFEGGSLKWKTGITTDWSSQIRLVGGQSATFDTNGQNITFATALTGSNSPLIKKGNGTLTLAAGSTRTGGITVEAGILKSGASTAGTSNAFGAGGTVITVKNGATLDIHFNHADNFGSAAKQYVVYAEGKGVADTSGTVYGGYVGAITDSGSVSSTVAPFSEIILTGDTTLSGRFQGTGGRWGIRKINANNHTITIVNSNALAWAISNAADAQNVRDIIIEQGRFWADGTAFGTEGSIYVNGNRLANNSVVRGELGNWYSSKTITKSVVINGGRIVIEGSLASISSTTYVDYGLGASLNNFTSFTLQGEVALATGNAAGEANQFLSNQGIRDFRVTGKMTGNGGFRFTGAVATLNHTPITSGAPSGETVAISRYATMYVLNNTNDFTGNVEIERGLLRMSDGSSSGKLGAGTSPLRFLTNDASIFDLFGTNQTIGALVSVSGTNHFVQNNRQNTTSTITVGNGHGDGTFNGVMRDFGTLATHNYAITNEGATGAKLALVKTGNGKQILTGINTFTGGTQIQQGHLQIGTGNTATSTAQLGLGNVTVDTGSTLSGNGIVGSSTGQILVNTGANLKVGVDGSTVAQSLKINGALTNNGTISFDLFNYTAGSGQNSNSDYLSIGINALIDLNGTLAVNNASASSSLTWTEGTWFRLIDWGTASIENRDVAGLTLGSMPTLSAGLEWKLDQLASLGNIYIGAVPEPQLVSLFALGTLTVIFRRRRC